MTIPTGIHQPVDASLYHSVSQFLAEEVVLLDENRLWEWYELLDDEFTYKIPIRVVRERGVGSVFPAGFYRQRDSKSTVKYRIERLDSGHGWAEDPASRTVRVLGPVAVSPTEDPDTVLAKSSILLYREQFQDPEPDFIAGRREDRITFSNGRPRLRSRIVWLAHPTLNSSNLGVFL